VSEYMNNQTERMNGVQRKETLKRLIRQLHEGRTVEDVKEEFAALLRDVGATEVAEIEQALIAEGLPESEVKRLCDVHVAVFRESLDAQARPESLPGHPVHTFRAENEAAGRVLDALQEALDALKATPGLAQLEQARRRLAKLREYGKHYLRKENILFPYLERHGFTGPSSVMWAIHDDVRAGWKALDELLSVGPGDDADTFNARVDELLEPLATAIREMFYKEEHILLPTALEKLSAEEWRAIRAQQAEVGYCYVEPGDQWPLDAPAAEATPSTIEGSAAAPSTTEGSAAAPSTTEGSAAAPSTTEGSAAAPSTTEGSVAASPPAEAQAGAGAAGSLSLDVGALTPQEVNWMLIHLPVDLTYVDQDDVVRFFSQTKERIFPRSPAIIGRKVQKCHPPASVHRVQRILDDFRAGRRDVAEFWIQMQGQFIHIRYFAIRDAEGEYQGTLEVSQDVTHIRALEGERRLLDEEGA